MPYQLDDGGRTVRVPVERVDELRLEFASQRPAVGGPHRLRDLRPHRVRHDRVPRARQLPPRARRRAGAHDLARWRKWRARACTSRWRRTRCSSTEEQPAKASVVLKLQEQPPARRPRPSRGITGLVAGQRRIAAARGGRHPRHLRPLAVASPPTTPTTTASGVPARAPAAHRARPVHARRLAARAGRRRRARARERRRAR